MRTLSFVQLSSRNCPTRSTNGPSSEASVTDNSVCQFAFLPNAVAYCGATPTDALSFFGNANQMRLILHTAAYWLLWRISQEIPKAAALAVAEFATLRLRLIKVAARVIETTSRVRFAFASACPDAGVFKAIVTNIRSAPT